jgi:hypothetical protein
MMSDGEVIIEAVGRAHALDDCIYVKESDSRIWVWNACAAEQIEAAIDEMGYKLVRKNDPGQ